MNKSSLMTNYGYCCINMQLRQQKPSITTNRSMIKRTFVAKGMDYASELIVQNCKDLRTIIKWNEANGLKLYRMSSDIMPWMSEYNISDLKDFKIIRTILEDCGDLAREYGQRITFHPGPFDVLASLNENVVTKSIADLNKHGEIFDLMGLPRTPYAAINIHINTTQGGKEESMQRFVDAFNELDPSVKSRLVVENDDKQKQYAVEDLYMGIYSKVGIPITFDYHHHWCHPGELTQEEALKMASTTWPKDVKQLCHYSSCKQIHEDASVMARAHADYIYEHINTYGLNLDIELEAKAKELAVQKYVKQFASQLV
jgi:UV DNA damage endonuclease